MKKIKYPFVIKGDMVDPPEGWKYGFPKTAERDLEIEEIRDWLVGNGYINHTNLPLDQIYKYTRILHLNERLGEKVTNDDIFLFINQKNS